MPVAVQAKPKTPNILFIIMDDVGIDQMKVFTYGGEDPPSTPTIDTLAQQGIRFRNTWSMPACSTSRAVIFTGRFPLRTNVYGALGPSDLANSQVSPYEMTLPSRRCAVAVADPVAFSSYWGCPSRHRWLRILVATAHGQQPAVRAGWVIHTLAAFVCEYSGGFA
jgi:hypothetical protein